MPKMERTGHKSIYKVRLDSGETRYRAYVSVGRDDQGRHRQRVLTATTLAEAKAKRAALVTEVSKGTYVQQRAGLTVDAYLDGWVAAKGRSVKPSTLAAYEHHLKPLRKAVGTKPLQKVTKADLERIVTGLLAGTYFRPNGVTPRTCNHAIALYRQVFNDATKEGLLSRSPAALVVSVTDHRDTGDARKRHNTWTTGQRAAFMAHVADDRLIGVWTLLGLGLRLGEAMGLRWDEDVDLDAGTVTIRRSRTRVNGHVVEGTPKSRLSRRTIVVGPEVLARLRTARLVIANEERLAAGAMWAGGAYVASDAAGRPLSPASVQWAFARHIKDAGLPRIRVHDLRHTSVTLMLEAGVPIPKVAAHHGHDIPLMLRVYAHPEPDEQTGAAADAMFG